MQSSRPACVACSCLDLLPSPCCRFLAPADMSCGAQMPVALVSMLGKTWAHVVNSNTPQKPVELADRRYTPCSWVLAPKAPEVLVAEDMQQDAR